MTQTTATLWLQLAAQATAIANDMCDPEEEQPMREIARRASRSVPAWDVMPDQT